MQTFGDVLQTLRRTSGLSTRALGERIHYSPAMVQHVESGKRIATEDFAQACDAVFETAPLLALLHDLDSERSGIRRRAFLGMTVIAVDSLGPAAAPQVIETIRLGLLDDLDIEEDWGALIWDFEQRYRFDHSPRFSASVLGAICTLKNQIQDRGTDHRRLAAIAVLVMLLGRYLSITGHPTEARSHFRSSFAIAERSGDAAVAAYVRARVASLGPYVGYSAGETAAMAKQALALNSGAPTLAVLDSHAAFVHLHALTGNLGDGLRAVQGMYEVAERLDGSEAVFAHLRATQFERYLLSKAGNETSAEQAYDRLRGMAESPSESVENEMCRALSLVRHGAIKEGIDLALGAVEGPEGSNRIVALEVAEVVHAVPRDHRSDELESLHKFAATGQMPWNLLHD